MKLKHLLSSAVAAATLFCAGAANAELYNFSISGDYSATWQLDTDLEPDAFEEGAGFAYYNVMGAFENAVGPYADITFFHAEQDGGMAIEDYDGGGVLLLLTDGPQLYSGSEAAPTFAYGTYEMTEFGGSGAYTLTISAVPEPATYGMLLLGAGVVGVALRRRSNRAVH